MTAYPSGTATFLFTDLEGSTRLWEQYPDGMRTALARHDAILRQAVETNGGQIIKTTGDGIHAVFETAGQGISAALAAQLALISEHWEEIQPQSLKVRMGLHSGEAELRGGDYYGTALNRAARLMSAGYGGQVLVSAATSELARDGLPSGARLMDLGEHRLKDLSRPEHIYQFSHPALPADFPPIKSLDDTPNNLPVQLTSFIGREQEIAEVENLLAKARLVTLTGSGGTGKTRLAQEAGAHLLADFPHGVWLVELAPLADPAQVIPTLAKVFGLQEVSQIPLEVLLTDYLRSKELLLLMDNCEHLIAACARLADGLLHQCPGLKILASSREGLGIAGEVSYRIPSLAESESIQLFCERARAANSRFSFTEANAVAIAAICRRLDGIPLAIELAAARSRLLSPEQIAARLDDRFKLLIGGSRTALPRQQTLRAMIDWSYDLLSEGEKRVLRIASVFAGGWTLEALETVAEDPDTLERLEQLVNKSLVATEEQGSQMRYYLLETIRQYAREKLFDSGMEEARQTRSRHLGYYVRLSEASVPRLIGAEMVECLDELELEQDNLRSAVEWAIQNEPFAALRMAELLPAFWGRRLSASEGYAWITEALEKAESEALRSGNDSSAAYLGFKARGLVGKAAMAFQLGDSSGAFAPITSAIELARRVEDQATLAYALALGATICGFLGDIQTARAWAQEAVDLSRKNGYFNILGMVAGFDMFIAGLIKQPIQARVFEEAERSARASGNPWVIGLALANIARFRIQNGFWAEAYALLDESTTLFKKIRDRSMYNMDRSEMGHLLRAQGRFSEAWEIYRETIVAYKEQGQYAAAAHELECFAYMAAAEGKSERALILLGAAEALRERNQTDMMAMERSEYDAVLTNLRSQVDPAALAKAWDEGRQMTIEQAIQLASK